MKAKIELTFTQYARATTYIEAASLEEASDLADEIEPDEVEDWDYFDGALCVDNVVEASPAEMQSARLLSQPASDPIAPDVTSNLPNGLITDLRRVLDYLMDDEASNYLKTSPAEDRENHIYLSLLLVDAWLSQQERTAA